MYFRDDRVQQAFEDRDLAGDLASTTNDYLGVFTQNIKGSKSDYWQHRILDSDVRLAADGSADVTLKVTVQNPSPPWVLTPSATDDPRSGYHTRWAGSAVAVFLPTDARVEKATVRGVPFKPVVRSVNGRPYFYRKVLLQPGAQVVIEVSYHVPAAASVGQDGTLTYGLSIDPQGLVVPEAVNVNPAPA